ncbi:MAG: UPF0182 family protein [Bacillota bacterium]
MNFDDKNIKDLNNKVIMVLVLIFLVLMVFTPVINLITDYLWFDSVDYLSTYLTIIFSKLKIFIPITVLITLISYFYVSILRKNYKRYFEDEIETKIEYIKLKIFAISFMIGSLFSYSFTNNLWENVLVFLKSENFNETDPIFNLDLGFYMFKLPLIKTILSMIIFILIWFTILTVFYFLVVYKKKKQRKEKVIDFNDYQKQMSIKQIFCSHSYKSLIRAITFLVISILILVGINYLLSRYKLLFSSVGLIYGAGYTDVNVTLLFYNILAGVSFVGAILAYVGYKKGNIKISLSGPVAIVAIHIISLIVAAVVQQTVVSPDEITKEKQYIENNIKYTQKAYGLNDVDFIDYNPKSDLTFEDINNNKEIINNIMINDHRPLKKTFNEIQGIRLYYKFNDIDVDRYNIDGKYTQTFIAPRELSLDNLRTESKTWINKHFKYTHGYGLVLSPVSKVDEDGQPSLLIKNIPPEGKMNIQQPRIYFGELTDDYIITNSGEKEFDYPAGSANVEYEYTGRDGVQLNGLNKLLFAIKQGSLKLLLSSNVDENSKISINRNIKKRLNKIAPFFDYDNDPYLVLNQKDGKLYWIIDGYTNSKNYPYSKPYFFNNKSINYIKNSLKVVIDAYDGDVNFYKYKDEPIVNTYQNIFPELIKDKEDMPEGLKGHVRYPQDFFQMQAEVYETYHVDDPGVYYNGEDVWQIANEKYMGSTIEKMNSKYVTFKLPESNDVEFLLTVPFTPNDKRNMSSLLIARNDHGNYGQLFTYKFPKDRIVKGPEQVENEIDQDSNISPQFSLWSQRGSKVLRGSIIVIPIENSLLYVEPIYLESDNENSLPEMKKIIIYYDNKIVMENSLQLALARIFGEYEEFKDEKTTDSRDLSIRQRELLEEINEQLNQQQKNIKELEKLIQEFNELNDK